MMEIFKKESLFLLQLCCITTRLIGVLISNVSTPVRLLGSLSVRLCL